MKPLSHGITAAFGSVLYAERNEVVKSWDNGRFWLGITDILNETKPLRQWDNGRFWLGIIACFDNNEKRPRFVRYIEEVHTRS